ncbi:MAG: hypothetical protein HY319_04150 [Armatimonadetes bacterium]|nr:hypothetical protein [Armatimonadota bacterium]
MIRLVATVPGGDTRTLARVWLEEGRAASDNPELMAEWQEEGIGDPPIFPEEGERFLDELLASYRSEYLWAERE